VTKTAILTTDLDTKSGKILDVIFQYRRLLDETNFNTRSQHSSYLSSHLQKLKFFIKQAKPLHCILPAFPAKSPNLKKVTGKLPDMGERISLKFLHELCLEIQQIYPPGMQITICSDGRVFSDLVCVSDEDVTEYSRELRHLCEEINAHNINFFNLEDIFNGLSFEQMRSQLITDYSNSVEDIRQLVKSNLSYSKLFNGIHRFLFEDYQVLQPEKSRNKVRSECKVLTYQVIQRSESWSTLLSKTFPHALRLSIHPQSDQSEKIGIHMMKSKDNWATPWHNVAVYNGQDFILMKRYKAETMGASLVYHKKRPSHFLLTKYSN